MTRQLYKKILSLALAILLGLGGMAVGLPTAYAAPPSPGVGEAYDGVDMTELFKPGNGIYYGTYAHATTLSASNYSVKTRESSATPILWRVMGEENNEGNITLLSEYVLDSLKFHSDWNSGDNYYNASYIRGWLNGTFLGSFKTAEQGGMATTTVVTGMYDWWNGAEKTGSYTSPADNYTYANVFPWTAADQKVYLPWGIYNNGNSTVNWTAGNTASEGLLSNHAATLKNGTGVIWWLRSPFASHAYGALIADTSGALDFDLVLYARGIRPAFKLNPSSVIFASEIKSSPVASKGETQADSTNYSTGDATNFKLTVLNDTISLTGLSADGQTVDGTNHPGITLATPGGSVAVAGTGTSGTNLTYKIVENSTPRNIVGYGQSGSSTTLTVNAKNLAGENLSDGSYTVYVWAQKNNTINSHEGSAPMYFTLDVGTAPAITTTALPNGQVDTDYTQTLAATGSTPINWSIVSGGGLPDGLTLVDNTISGKPTKEGTFNFTVKAQNALGEATQALSIVISDAPAPTLQSIAIATPATKLTYTVGDSLDISGMVVTGTYDNGSTKTETVTDTDVTGFDSSAPAASQTLTVTVGGKIATYTIAINAAPVTNATISPASASYDLASPTDISTTITWNSAASVSDLVYSVSPDTTLYTMDAGDYTVSGNNLTIDSSFFSGLSLTAGSAIDIDINFNTGDTATLTVQVVNSYTPSDDDALSSLSVNGTPVSGFDPNDIEYNVELPYGTASATVTATASDSKAQVGITQASSLPGSATVEVTAEDGTTSRTYTINLTVATAPPASYTVTFNSNGSTYAAITVSAGQCIGSAGWPSNPVRSSYTFGGWFTGENGTGDPFTYDTPVNAATTVYAKWTYNGGGGGSSSDGGSTASSKPTYKADVDAGSGSAATLPVTVDKNSGSASVDVGTGSGLVSGGKSTVISVPTVPDVDTYMLGIPVPSLLTTGVQGTLIFDTDTGNVTVPSNMLTGVEGISGSKAQISIGQGDKDNLPDDVKAAIGDRPLIQLTLSVDGKQADWSNPNAAVTVSIPYTPTADELKNPESIVIWYIDGSGNVVTIPNGHYDPATGMITFDTIHFSDYAVAYNKVSFNDVATGAWYNKAVSFIAARGITGGTGSENYSPDAKLTRGEFLVLLMKAYGIAPDTNSTDNFSDAGNTYYTGYLAAAKRLGITTGVGNNQYAPGKEITRQEMFTLLYNALKVVGQLPEDNSGKTLTDFTDAGQIDSWAKDAMSLLVEMGTISGSNGKLSPAGTASRAEMAQILYNFLIK